MSFKVVAFYKFLPLERLDIIKLGLHAFCTQNNITGTILIASEGINATLAGYPDPMDALMDLLIKNFSFTEENYKFSSAEKQPFEKMKVKIKKEIVTFKQENIDPNQQVGTYIDPKDWNALLEDPNILVIDTRNDFEVGLGTFEGAQDPQTECFSEFPDYVKGLDTQKHKKVAMFCTGGIRCEKASSYMLSKGFETVYHLKGGILKYLETIPQEESKWIGECFVFDDRIALGHGLKEKQQD